MKASKIIIHTLAACLISVSIVSLATAGPIAEKTVESTVVGAKKGALPATSSVDDLETTLKATYVGTYAIYSSLPDEHKLALYSSVKQGGNIQNFRDRLVRMRLQR